MSICNHTFLDAFLIPGKGHISTACWHKSHCRRDGIINTHSYIHTHIRRKTWHPPTLSHVDCHMVPINFCQSQQASQPLTDADKAISTAEGLLCFPPPTHRILVGFFFFLKSSAPGRHSPTHGIAIFLGAPWLECPSLHLRASRLHFTLCGDGVWKQRSFKNVLFPLSHTSPEKNEDLPIQLLPFPPILAAGVQILSTPPAWTQLLPSGGLEG